MSGAPSRSPAPSRNKSASGTDPTRPASGRTCPRRNARRPPTTIGMSTRRTTSRAISEPATSKLLQHLVTVFAVRVELRQDGRQFEPVPLVEADRLFVRDPDLKLDPADAAHHAGLDEGVHHLPSDALAPPTRGDREHQDPGLAVRTDDGREEPDWMAVDLRDEEAVPPPAVDAGDFDSIRSFARDSDFHGRTFRVRARGVGVDVDATAVEGQLGADFGRTGVVDLEQPSMDYRLLVGEEFFLGRVVHRIDRARLEATKVAHRPFSLPISLHPKFARALLNLSRVPMARFVLEPFCGTGGLLLEALSIGLRPIGLDRGRRLVLGCRASLRRAGAGRLGVADAGRLPLRGASVHGIATDPPYGRAASTRGEPIASLYERTFRAFRDLLPPGAHAAVVLPTEAMIDLDSEHLERIEAHAPRAHRSLVRP